MEDIVSEICRCCKQIKPISEFAKNRNTKTGYYIYCRQCISNKSFIKNNKTPTGRIRRKIGIKDMHSEIIRLMGGSCARCGYSDVRALQIDHINGGGSKELRTLGQWKTYQKVYYMVLDGSAKREYQILCANCNWIKRHENKEH
jgi:hypothetical protein